MTTISAPVGRNVPQGKGNFTKDVAFVQVMLNNWITMGPLNGWVKPLSPDGICGGHTKDAIEFFQAIMLGWKSPDGRIDPGGQTLKVLTGPLTLRPELDPSTWSKPAKPPAAPTSAGFDPVELTIEEITSLSSGGDTQIAPFGTNIVVRSGEVWRGPEGDRLVIAGATGTHGNVVFLQLTATGVSRKLGGLYKQHRVGFQEDLGKGAVAGEVVRRTSHIQQLIRIEMYVLMGVMSVVGGTPVLLWTIGSGIGEFVAHNKSKFPKWVAAVTVALAARKIVKAYAPTFYDKVIDSLLLGAWKGAGIVIKAYGSDIASKIPEAMASDSEKAAKATGALIGKLGTNGWNGKTTAAKAVVTIAIDVAVHAIKSIPFAVKLEAEEIVKKLKGAGVAISQAEGEAIVLEIAKHAVILEPEFMKLKRALDDC